MAKYLLEIETKNEPAEMITWALDATEGLDQDALWTLTCDGLPLLKLDLELRED